MIGYHSENEGKEYGSRSCLQSCMKHERRKEHPPQETILNHAHRKDTRKEIPPLEDIFNRARGAREVKKRNTVPGSYLESCTTYDLRKEEGHLESCIVP